MESNSTADRTKKPDESLREWISVCVVLFITAAAYLNTFRFDFAFDDYDQILYNPFVKSWKYVPQYFVSSVWKQMSALAPGNYYRPMFMVWTRLNYALFSNNPKGWHIAAVLLHVAVTWLVYRTVRAMTGQFTLAWITALLFGVHPIHHEVVAWISGATESLFAFFFLAAFLAYLRFRKTGQAGWMACSCFLYALALLSKETAIIFPALLFVYDLLVGDPDVTQDSSTRTLRWVRPARSALLYVPFALIYLVARYKALSGFSHPEQYQSVSTWLLTLPSLLFFYTKHWLFPIRLAEFYDVYFQTHLSFAGVVIPGFVLISIATALWALRSRLGRRELGCVAIWIVIPLLPALDTFAFAANELVHDRYFYVPSIGAALLVALMIECAASPKVRVFGQPLYAVTTALLLAVALSLCTARATGFWTDNLALYSRGHEIAPSNSAATANLAAELIDHQEFDKAQSLLEANYIKDNYEFPFNLARVHYAKRDYPIAEEYIRRTIAMSPIFPDAYVYLSQIELKQGRPLEAQKSVRHAVELAPNMPVFRTAYGIVLELNGDCANAMPQFETALALNPGDGITEREIFRCQHPSVPQAIAPTSFSPR